MSRMISASTINADLAPLYMNALAVLRLGDSSYSTKEASYSFIPPKRQKHCLHEAHMFHYASPGSNRDSKTVSI